MIGRVVRPATLVRVGLDGFNSPRGASGLALVARDVALKILPQSFASDPNRLMRFERKAKTLASFRRWRLQRPPTLSQPDHSGLSSSGTRGVESM